jgi:ABC-type antimicrobial peptide transport system permease subunit
MLINHFKIAWRNLRNKLSFSLINIAGLAIGMAGAILIFTWVQNEYSYDDFHANKNELYKVWYRYPTPGWTGTQDVVAGPVGKALEQEYPEIKSASRIYWSTDRLFNYVDKTIKAQGNDVDPPFLTMFSFPLLEGNARNALADPASIVITQKLARLIFGDADPLNKIVKINNKDAYKITGVLKDLPANTEFNFDYLVSLAAKGNTIDNAWNSNSYYTYVQLRPGASLKKVNDKVKNLVIRHSPESKAELFLYAFTRMHLHGNFENGQVSGGRITVVRLLSSIAGIILLIACINFMNLSTAQSQKRAKEVGVRKVIGASRFGLINQFLSESLLITFIAGLLSLILVALCLPSFNQLTEKSLVINYNDPLFWLSFFGFIAFTGLLAGSYPAFMLSSFKPVKVLKGSFKGNVSFFNPRKILVVLQFSVAIVLIVSTIVIYRQIRFAQERDMGYNANNLIEVPMEGDITKNFSLIKNDLISSGAAASICKTSFGVTIDGSIASGYRTDGDGKEQEKLQFSRFATSGDFVKTMGLKLVAGRDIDFAAYPADSASCLLNESAVTQMGLKNPIGKLVKYSNGQRSVVGVFKDFIIRSPYVNVNPMIVFGSKDWAYNTVIKLNASKTTAVSLQLAEQIFKKYNPAYPFTYQFVDKEYEQKFNDQRQTGTLSAVFAGLTIFISCLGLFGMAAYMAENRSKEIGIRKVLGASVTTITQMLTREFVQLVIIAIVIATPVAWWAMNKWLQDFVYRIQIGWLTFVLAGSAAIGIAILTVSFQSVKAALANPVNSIKAE